MFLKYYVRHGIIKVGNKLTDSSIIIFDDFVDLGGNIMNRKKPLPIGYENFKKIIDNGLYYIDKSMLIYKILENKEENLLITRPRRFGKTLNMSMLKYFFDINEKENEYLFDGLEIARHYDEVKEYRNAFPVISLSLKEAKQNCFDDAFYNIRLTIQNQFEKYRYAWESDKVSVSEKKQAEQIMDENAEPKVLGNSVRLLTSCLYKYYGRKAVILIDEYDVPLESAYLNVYYEEMVGFIRTLFSSALKTNDNLEFSVITGCLRVSKESIFTGLNNLTVATIMSRMYSSCCGFTQDEVNELLKYYGQEEKLEELKIWYDGYIFGRTEVYNPWSVINQVKEWRIDCDDIPQPWWINTSGNDIIRTLVEYADDEINEQIEELIQGKSITTTLNENVTYMDIKEEGENIWSFLYYTGYLKIIEVIPGEEGEEEEYRMVIPNLEVRRCYRKIIRNYFKSHTSKNVNKSRLYAYLLEGKADEFAESVTEIMEDTISFYDTAENFYHGFLAGILTGYEGYRVKSNRENGNGRTDLTILQKRPRETAVIIEFKVCGSEEELEKTAEKALEQIENRKYDSEIRMDRYKNILKYGIAFCKKECCARMKKSYPKIKVNS